MVFVVLVVFMMVSIEGRKTVILTAWACSTREDFAGIYHSHLNLVQDCNLYEQTVDVLPRLSFIVLRANVDFHVGA